MKKCNQYDLSGEYGIGYTSNTDEEFYFDLEDFPIISEYTWSVFDGKICTYTYTNNKKQKIQLPRLILGVEDKNIVVKYINWDTYDNRKKNLKTTRNRREGWEDSPRWL